MVLAGAGVKTKTKGRRISLYLDAEHAEMLRDLRADLAKKDRKSVV